MFEREVTVQKVRDVVKDGETIEDYSTEMPDPSRLILGFQGKRPFHVVVSESQETREITVITVYVPDPRKWDKSFTSRRS
jgi:hypothetical protein